MFQQINSFLVWFDDLVWGLPLIIFILAVGIILTIRLGGLQIIHLPKALKFMVKNEEGGTGGPVLDVDRRLFRDGNQVCRRSTCR
jgi:AGCS family alanine or glycine:cation symporter